MKVHLSRKAALFSYSRRLWYRPQAPEGPDADSDSIRHEVAGVTVRL